jgi:sugar phosphate isomerase/epimerase
LIGHVHVSDSNRRPPRQGHTDFHAVAAGLKSIGYKGYLSVEALPLPDSQTAARMAMDGMQKFFGQPAGTLR